MATQQQLTGLELVKQETPTLQALIALNVGSDTDVHALVAQEIEYLQMHCQLKPDFQNCLPISMVQAVKTVLKKNLTLDPSAGLVYLKPRWVNLAKKGGQDDWQMILECTETANGAISVARQCGRILDVERPKVKKDPKGKVAEVSFRYLVPSIPTPRWEEVEFDESDFRRWQIASHKENSKNWKSNSGKPQPNIDTLNYANANYTSFNGGIDPEFARAKAIKHGLKKLGTNPNEGRAKTVYIDKKEVVVEASKANEEASDSYETSGNGFTEYEEVNSTMYDFDDNPNSNEL